MVKTAKLELSVWYSEKSRRNHVAGGGFRSTVNADPASKRYHANLYRKLAKFLREAGMPAPMEKHSDNSVNLTADQKRELSEFLQDKLQQPKFEARTDVTGIASGNLFGVLEITNRGLAKKLQNRTGLVSAARDLGFRIDAGKGGSRAGTVVWEYIALPE
ncbi:MAG: hypothetical protein E5W55_01120 [Mesorhizobium sp.]|nr:MAG: hypothetical protein E5W55_01120 [Mesorhizobium sp.]